MADNAYDEMIRRDERERIARLLRVSSVVIESFAAPGKAVLLAAQMIASTSDGSGSDRG